MKKIGTLIVAVVLGYGGFAQRIARVSEQHVSVLRSANNTSSARTTTRGRDTLSNISDVSTLALYKVGSDSGYVTGTNFWGDQAFAERYDFNWHANTVQVIGVIAFFGGKVNPLSTHAITFNIWDQSAPQAVAPALYYNGFPNNLLDTLTVPVTQLGIGPVIDTEKAYFFATPSAVLSSSFFAGYSINYNYATLNGDTLGLISSSNGSRALSTIYSIDSVGDTALNVQNATMGSDNVWYDNYTQDDSILNDLAIYPIINTATQLNVNGITRNALTFYGNYPNPADGSTDIKFSLAKNTSVTIQITDMVGRAEKTIKEDNLGAGTYVIPVNTADLAAGDHLYLVRTSGGDGMAGKMSVIH